MNISEILAVSNGTLATLTGFSTTHHLQIVLDWWVQFELDNSTTLPSGKEPTWQDSWNAFKASPEYPTAFYCVDVYGKPQAHPYDREEAFLRLQETSGREPSGCRFLSGLYGGNNGELFPDPPDDPNYQPTQDEDN